MREEYYDRRASEYDDAYVGDGMWSLSDAPGLAEEVGAIEAAIRKLDPARTLDVACGTGFLTRHLVGEIVGCDFSFAMLAVARRAGRIETLVRADALALPFADGAFERVFSSHFYGRLEPEERARFLAEARRMAPELVVVDTPYQEDHPAEGLEERTLLDGSSFTIYKRYFRAEELLDELGGGRVFYAGRWFLGVRCDA